MKMMKKWIVCLLSGFLVSGICSGAIETNVLFRAQKKSCSIPKKNRTIKGYFSPLTTGTLTLVVARSDGSIISCMVDDKTQYYIESESGWSKGGRWDIRFGKKCRILTKDNCCDIN